MMKYHGAPLYYTDLLSDCNLVFTILFTIECVMKVGCFGPKVRNICGQRLLASLDGKSRSIILDPPCLTFRARPFALVGHLTTGENCFFETVVQWCLLFCVATPGQDHGQAKGQACLREVSFTDDDVDSVT